MKIVITESQYKKLIKEDLGVSRASIPFTNLIYDFVSGNGLVGKTNILNYMMNMMI